MHSLAIATLCLVLCLPGTATAGPDEGITSTVTLDKTQYLSTEHANATLSVTNGSRGPISYTPLSVRFLTWTGSYWQEWPMITTISRPIRPVVIDPGSRFSTRIFLPGCIVDSDPCARDVKVRYAVDVAHKQLGFEVTLPRYEFVADPTATYRIEGLAGNHPLFIAQGSASDTFFPETMLTFTTRLVNQNSSACFDLGNQVMPLLRDAGLVPGGASWCDSQDSGWNVRVTVEGSPGQHQSIDTIERNLVKHLPQIVNATQKSVLNLVANDQGLSQKVGDDSHRQAQKVAWLGGAGDLERFYGGGDRISYTLRDSRTGSQPATEPSTFPFDQIVITDPMPPLRVTVTAKTRNIYAGSSSVRDVGDQGAPVAATSFTHPSWPWNSSPLLTTPIVIAADRPELYVLGASTAKAALSLGLEPEYPAILDARERTRDVAKLLGVKLGFESLFSLYPYDPDDETRTVGIATAFSDADPRNWERIRERLAFELRRVPKPQLESIPILVPNEATKITEMSNASTTIRDGFMLRAVVAFPAGGSNAVGPRVVSTQLGKLPDVSRVEYTTHRQRPYSVDFDIALTGFNPSAQISEVTDLLHRAYAQVSPVVTVTARPFAPTCDEIEQQLLGVTIRQNWTQAKMDARKQNRRIRKLVLVVPFPAFRQACTPIETAPLQAGYPWPGTTIIVSSLMVFRTY